MSAPEPPSPANDAAGMRLRCCVMDIVQIAVLRGRAPELERIARGRGLQLPALRRAAIAADQLALCVRPERWLLLSSPAFPGATAGVWQAACAGFGAAVDLSCGLTALHLAGSAVREVLVRACRLDLDPDAFPVGTVAATIMAQVSVILAALPSGLLLLTPSTTARHFREWLVSTAAPFGLMLQSDISLVALSGDKFS